MELTVFLEYIIVHVFAFILMHVEIRYKNVVMFFKVTKRYELEFNHSAFCIFLSFKLLYAHIKARIAYSNGPV